MSFLQVSGKLKVTQAKFVIFPREPAPYIQMDENEDERSITDAQQRRRPPGCFEL